MNYKYIAYMSDGVKLECNNFATVYRASLHTIRGEQKDLFAVIICNQENNKPIVTMTNLFLKKQAIKRASSSFHTNLAKNIFSRDCGTEFLKYINFEN